MSIVSEPVARYFPPSSGHYAIKPGFYRLGHDFGNGEADRRLFQLDRQFSHYRRAKQSARREDLDKYLCVTDAGRTLEPALNRFISARLCAEYPEHFRLQQTGERQRLECHLTGDALVFTADGRYLDCRPGERGTAPPYHSGLDALAMQVQEDLTLVCLNGTENRLCAIHLCQPNHWAPRDKIGRDFVGVHQPVPGMERINPKAAQLLQASLRQGPFVRFAWGITTDDRLNHHPEAPARWDREAWSGRAFDPASPAAWLRVERQTLYGLPQINAVLFGIRTYHYALTDLSPTQQRLLSQALASMSATSLRYKGLAGQYQDLQAWLRGLYDAS
ncbi:heme-dependent oxidative N-demethylase family protein [Thiohalophilus thiocyanatoxydans]|uniref:Uncharacterized protein DUF3445 n=1 Tax=Thiohalophilus thiocyanatoxydans TaxID=381308 RepID=A0A4V3H3S7_9GAMM|nr:DUF3445 domain-containing protein [Thiohalophilus thiocyanatoxydans]TDY00445.1 uncharacterized protein DUF3445 [Thiohalophilus thiocyanatoxydans]